MMSEKEIENLIAIFVEDPYTAYYIGLPMKINLLEVVLDWIKSYVDYYEENDIRGNTIQFRIMFSIIREFNSKNEVEQGIEYFKTFLKGYLTFPREIKKELIEIAIKKYINDGN